MSISCATVPIATFKSKNFRPCTTEARQKRTGTFFDSSGLVSVTCSAPSMLLKRLDTTVRVSYFSPKNWRGRGERGGTDPRIKPMMPAASAVLCPKAMNLVTNPSLPLPRSPRHAPKPSGRFRPLPKGKFAILLTIGYARRRNGGSSVLHRAPNPRCSPYE